MPVEHLEIEAGQQRARELVPRELPLDGDVEALQRLEQRRATSDKRAKLA